MRLDRHAFFLVLSLGTLNALTPFTIDLYLPAFPEIAADLNTSVLRMSLTVSVYFIGFALGQIIYGPLLDRFGRQLPIYIGLAVYLLATLGCMTATSFESLLIFRFIAALGGSAASVGAMTMARDYFPPEDVARVFAFLMLVLSASPLFAPSIGSVIVMHLGWRPVFAILAGLALIDIALVAFAFPRAYTPDRSVSLRPGPMLRTFRDVLREPQFRTYAFAGSLSFAGLFVFVSGSPAVFMDHFGVSAQGFGFIFAILAGGMIAGGQLNHILLHHRDSSTIFRRALHIQVTAGIAFLVGSLAFDLNVWTTVALLLAYLVCAGITLPNAVALALMPFTKNIGSASSLVGFLQLGTGALAAAIVGLLDIEGAMPLAIVLAGCAVAALVTLKSTSFKSVSAVSEGATG
jgi:DHA1 family bicyclomycin/chloramphenicol resistance-like MFS transporter